jgi:Domain of unknown function (DUF4167)
LPSPRKEADSHAGRSASRRNNLTFMDEMRSGSNQRPPARYNGNRPPQHHRPPPQHHQAFDSNGPSVKIRGNAHQVFERYVTLAREAAIAGDPVAAENLYQHAEHYFRLNNVNRDSNQQRAPQPITPSDIEMASFEPIQSEAAPDEFPEDSQPDRNDDQRVL